MSAAPQVPHICRISSAQLFLIERIKPNKEKPLNALGRIVIILASSSFIFYISLYRSLQLGGSDCQSSVSIYLASDRHGYSTQPWLNIQLVSTVKHYTLLADFLTHRVRSRLRDELVFRKHDISVLLPSPLAPSKDADNKSIFVRTFFNIRKPSTSHPIHITTPLTNQHSSMHFSLF